jgi:predicted transcriptional regulator
LPAEFEHITVALKAIRGGKKTRDELNCVLKEYYSNYYKGTEWSPTVVNTMRAGLLTRLNDLGLIKREKHGKFIRYHITDTGEKYVRSISEKDEVKQITNHQAQREEFNEVLKQ